MASGADPARFLWILRHAKTLQDPPPGGADRERELAPRGERDADALGKRLASPDGRKSLGGLDGAPFPGIVLSSSAVRAAQTAERVWAEVVDPPISYLDSLYAATPKEVLRQVGQLAGEAQAVMVVGHNPTTQQLVTELVDRHDKAGRKRVDRQSLVTCALAVFRLPVGSWKDAELGTGTLLALVTPPY